MGPRCEAGEAVRAAGEEEVRSVDLALWTAQPRAAAAATIVAVFRARLAARAFEANSCRGRHGGGDVAVARRERGKHRSR